MLFLFIAAAIEGDVREAGTRLKLDGIAVVFRHAGGELSTDCDLNGHFRFEAVPPGEAALVFASVTHQTREVALSVSENSSTRLTVYLLRDASGFETQVLGKRDATQISQTTVSRPELLRAPGAFGDPLRAVQSLPGIARAPLFLGTLNMRGTLGRDASIMLDGTPIPLLYHVGIGPSVLSDAIIEDIVFAPGTYGVQFGRSSSGIVDVRLRKPSFENVSGKASIDLLMATFNVNIPLGERTSLSLGVRRSYFEAFAAPISALADTGVAVPQFTDYHARLFHDAGKLGRFDLLVFGSYDAMSFMGGKDVSAPTPQWMFHGVKPSWELRAGPLQNRLTMLGQYVDNSIGERDLSDTATGSQTRQWQLYLRDDVRLALTDEVKLLAGVDLGSVYDHVRSNMPTALADPDDPLTELNQLFQSLQRAAQPAQWVHAFAAYGAVEIKHGPLRVLPGMRLEALQWNNAWAPAYGPRMQSQLTLREGLSILGSVGLYQKAPAVELISQLPADKKPITSLQSALGVEWQITQAVSAQVTGYFNALWDDVTLLNDNDTLYYGRVNGRIYGGEVFLRHRPYNNFFAWLSYALSRSERHENGTWRLASVDQTHTLTLLASYVLPRGWQLGARFRLSSGAPYTPVSAAVWSGAAYRDIKSLEPRSARLAMYHQLDIRVDKTWTFDMWRLTFFVDLFNVYFSPVPIGVAYSYDFSRASTRTQFFPLLPFLGVQAEF